MKAVISTGGKQYFVSVGDRIRVEKIEAELGSSVSFDEVLALSGEKSQVGTPFVEAASVQTIVTRQARAPKVIVFKKKRRQGYRRTQGHRQYYTELFVQQIQGAGAVVKAETEAPVKAAEQIHRKAGSPRNKPNSVAEEG